MSQRALLLVNRNSRRGDESISQAVSQLQALGFDLTEESTENTQDLAEIMRQYRDRIDLIIIGGGDGTLNAAVEGLIDTKLPLGILPMGTANDLARTLGISTDLSQACQIIADGYIRHIDLGWVNGKHFFNVASMGLSVEITQQLDKKAKRRWGVLAYGATALKVFWHARPFEAEIRIKGASFHTRSVQIAVGNGRYYGGGMVVADDATIDDKRLDVYSLQIEHWWQMLLLMPAMRQGQHAQWPGVRALEGQEIEIITNRPLAINTDGEITSQTPAKFRLLAGVLPVFVPSSPTVPGLQNTEYTKATP
jgi:diacylglycerol kinase (ATP)